MIGRRRKDGTIQWMGRAADALSALLTPKRRKPKCRLCRRPIKRGMINSCIENHCPRYRSET